MEHEVPCVHALARIYTWREDLMSNSHLSAYSVQHLQIALDCVYDHQLALECISSNADVHLANLVAITLMDSQLRSYLHVLADLEWDFTAADLAWHDNHSS